MLTPSQALSFFVLSLASLPSLCAVAPVPSPSAALPPDWVTPWRQADLLFGTAEPREAGRQAVVGNGYVATVVGSPDVYVSGVFNGNGSGSTRARIPATNAITVTNALHTGSALDLRKGVFFRRSYFKPCIACAEADIEQRWYAHRFYPSLLVHEIKVATTRDPAGALLELELANNNGTASKDIDFVRGTAPPGSTVYRGYTRRLETPDQKPTYVAVALNNVPSRIIVNATGETFTFYYITAIRTSHDSADPLKDALSDLKTAQNTQDTLLMQHIEHWNKIWEAGIEVGGRFELSQAVNSSIYYLLSSIRAGDYRTGSDRFASAFSVPSFSLSPGSLATTGYWGHSFWDAETWMFPTLALFYPEAARNLLQYRHNRIPKAQANAILHGFKGLKFPWESAFTGTEVCGWPPGLLEHHLMGDIALAVEQYWYLLKDIDWLKEEGIDLAVGIARFWLSHLQWNDITKKYSINNVVGPDEYAVGPNATGVNDNAFTNTVARISIQFAVEVMKELGMDPDPTWMNIANAINVPFNETSMFHPEHADYRYGTAVKQADTILMGYPALGLRTEQERRNDLAYYQEVTDPTGPAMSWSMFSIGWLELEEFELAAKYFNQSYQRNLNLPFNAWQETINGGCPHFLTGAGGFLQGLWAGYGGVRINDGYITFSPVLPEHTTYIKYRQFHYLGAQIDIMFDSSTIEFELTSEGSHPLVVVSPAGHKTPLFKNRVVSMPIHSGPFQLYGM